MNIPVNQLLQCCSPVIECIAQFMQKDQSADTSINFREKMLTAFTGFNQKCTALAIESEQAKSMKYVMAALVDEIILNSRWEGRIEWMSKTMQLHFFGEHIAGEKFFSRLNALRQDSYKNIDLLEGYYLCLQLGFAGVYRVREQEQLQALQIGLRDQIQNVRGHYNTDLMPDHASAADTDVAKHFDLPLWLVLAFLFSTIVIVYLSNNLIIDKRAHQALMQIHSYRDLIGVA